MGQTILTVILGLLGFVVAIIILIYFKMFVAKLFNIRIVDRRGKTLYDPESFGNVNSFLKEKATSIIPIVKLEDTIQKKRIEKEQAPVASPNKQVASSNKIDYLKFTDFKTIINNRTLLKKEKIGVSVILKVTKITSESPFLDKSGEQIYQSFPPYNAIKMKLVFCNTNSEPETLKTKTRQLIVKALEAERNENFKKADQLFKEYLDKVQLRFSLLSNNKLFDTIQVGDEIVGKAEHISYDNYDFLTIDSSSVRPMPATK